MSILSKYEAIRKRIGEEKYHQIEKFLENHPHYYLSDVYYRESVWNEMEEWIKNNQEDSIMSKRFTVKDNDTKREYIVTGNDNTSLDIVWLSEKSWFSSGSSVTITAEDGISKTYIKE